MIRYRHAITLLTLCIFCQVGCGKIAPAPEVKTRSEAEKKLLTICQEEYKLPVVTRTLAHTLYIYLPLKESFLIYKAKPSAGPAPASSEAQWKPNVNSLKAEFNNGTFNIRYDISKIKTYSKDLSYTSAYTEEYQKAWNSIFTAVYRAYGDLWGKPGNTEAVPEFIVVVVTDITNGLASRETFTFEDYKRSIAQALPPEEFTKRRLSDLSGSEAAIGDEHGAYVDYKEMTWPEFLTRQIENRINFKYQRSDFPPSEDPRKEILGQTAATIQAYGFRDFQSVVLIDLATNRQEPVSAQELLTYGQE